MVAFGRVVLLAAFAWACGGRSVSIQDGEGGDGSDGGRGGQAGFSGAPRGGSSTGATGGVPAGGAVGFGGSPATGGMVIAGQAGTGGDACPSGVFTTISGTVRDPAGELPLYNVLVYEPSGPLTPMREGIDCTSICPGIDPRPLNAALTDTRGQFRLQVSSTPFVPVVLQIGKWRREITLGPVGRCVNTDIDDPALLRLPRSQAEGHMPRIAAVTAAWDSLECMLRRLGIADQEFTTETGAGAVNLYVGCYGDSGTGADHFNEALGGASFPTARELFASPEKLASYDFVLLGCDGGGCRDEKRFYGANLERYANEGGRLFLDHLESSWLWNGSAAWRAVAEFDTESGSTVLGVTASVDQMFPKGFALSEWLINVEASTFVGELQVNEIGELVRNVMPPAQRWMYRDTSVLSMTMNTPLEVPDERKCGRVTFNAFHAAGPGGDESRSEIAFPDGCQSGPLSPQETAMVFQLFDQTSCISNDPAPPEPPR